MCVQLALILWQGKDLIERRRPISRFFDDVDFCNGISIEKLLIVSVKLMASRLKKICQSCGAKQNLTRYATLSVIKKRLRRGTIMMMLGYQKTSVIFSCEIILRDRNHTSLGS